MKPRRWTLLALLLLSLPFSLRAQDSAKGPDASLQALRQGNERFAAGKPQHPHQSTERRAEIAPKQYPMASILGCSDSRVPPELVFDQGLGDLFVVRTAGNVADPVAVGSLEYSTAVLGSPLIVVLGHERCGAVDATLKGQPVPGQIQAVVDAVKPALAGDSCKKSPQVLDCSIEANVDYIVKQLQTSGSVLPDLIKQGKLKIVGGIVDLDTGKVAWKN
ncbi:MAG: carbonic anhydrase [bacterium]